MKLTISKIVTVAVITGFVVLYGQSGFSFCVYNKSSIPIKAWEDPGDFSKEIKPGKNECCNWGNKDCNPSGERTATLMLWINSKDEDSHFSAILPMQAGGYAVVKEEDRSRLKVTRKNLYVESYTWDNKLVVRSPYGINANKRDVHFLVTADPQYFKYYHEEKNRDNSDRTLNYMVRRLQGSCTSTTYLGNCEIRGFIVAGDLTQQGKKEELSWYKDGGIKGAVRFAYDGLGNHDYGNDRVKNFVLKDRRRETVATSVSIPHYSWDWHDVHFIQLNLFPSDDKSPSHKDLNPYKSLDFLKTDLEKNVGTTGRPVVLAHHYGFDSFSEGTEGWWTDDQRKKYWETIAAYNIKAIFTGHLHAAERDPENKWHLRWLRPSGVTSGPAHIDTFVSGAALNGIFLDVRINESTLTVERWVIKSSGSNRLGTVTVPMK